MAAMLDTFKKREQKMVKMSELLGELDQLDAKILQCDLENKLTRQSIIIMRCLSIIEGWETDPYKHGSMSTLLTVKNKLLEATTC